MTAVVDDAGGCAASSPTAICGGRWKRHRRCTRPRVDDVMTPTRAPSGRRRSRRRRSRSWRSTRSTSCWWSTPTAGSSARSTCTTCSAPRSTVSEAIRPSAARARVRLMVVRRRRRAHRRHAVLTDRGRGAEGASTSLDGHGIKLLAGSGRRHSRSSPAARSRRVAARAAELGIAHVLQGIEDKLAVFERLRRAARARARRLRLHGRRSRRPAGARALRLRAARRPRRRKRCAPGALRHSRGPRGAARCAKSAS